MTTVLRAIATAAAVLAIAGPAVADDFKVDFTYARSATIEANYAQFENTARRACRAQYRNLYDLSDQNRAETACRGELLHRIVARIADPQLTAYHQRKITPAGKRRLLADRR